jgi:predicted secreted protein
MWPAQLSSLILVVAAAACSPQTPLKPASQPTTAQTNQSQAPAPKVVGLADNGAAVMLAPGQLLRIELEGTPTAGYVWQLSRLPDRARLVSQTSRPSNPEGRAAGMVGGNDWSVFTVESTSPTRVTIELVYGRPWELQAGAEPERRFRIDTVMAVN